MFNLILNNMFLLIFVLFSSCGILGVKSDVLKNSTEVGDHINFYSRTLNDNFNVKNMDIDLLKKQEQTATNFTAVKENALSTQINFSQNLEIVMDVIEKLKNPDCIRDMKYVLTGLIHSEKWALQMFDAFPKFPVGLLYGNMYQLGNFDECTSVKYWTNNDTELLGQYCLADIVYKLTKNNSEISDSFENEPFTQHNRLKFNTSLIHWALCLPSTCRSEDASILVKEIFMLIADFNSLDVIINEKNCYYEKSLHTSIGDIIYGCVIAVFLLFIILATILHLCYIRRRAKCLNYSIDTLRNQNQKSMAKEIVLSFSLIQTVKKLLKTKPTELNLECLCGIKFLSMFFIVAGHSIIFIFGGPVANINFVSKQYSEIQNSLFINSPLMVDTFLLVSGFLMCRLLLIELDKRKGKINILVLYIVRYIRLTPAYLVVIGFYLTWLPKLGDGPLWKEIVETENERCLNSWWTNLLYINNYVKTDSLCMFQAWYLAVDYHLFIIAPFIIYALWRWSNMGKVSITAGTIFVAIVPAYFTLKDNLDPTLLAFPPEIRDPATNFYFVNAYIKTHMRASSYFLGMLFGYTVHKIQYNGTKIPNLIIWIGWILAALFGTASMLSIQLFFEPNYSVNRLETALYASFHRIAWSLAIGWVIVMCVTDNAATVNKFLAWNFFVPLSRLTYCAYLVNGLVLIYHKGTIREAISISKFEMSYTVVGHLLMTFFIAFFLCICFESPIHGLEKILLRRNDSNSKSGDSTNTLRIVEENRNNK